MVLLIYGSYIWFMYMCLLLPGLYSLINDKSYIFYFFFFPKYNSS